MFQKMLQVGSGNISMNKIIDINADNKILTVYELNDTIALVHFETKSGGGDIEIGNILDGYISYYGGGLAGRNGSSGAASVARYYIPSDKPTKLHIECDSVGVYDGIMIKGTHYQS